MKNSLKEIKAKDLLYVIFVGTLIFIAGGFIIGGVSFLLTTLIRIDFLSLLVYFFLSITISRNIRSRYGRANILYTIIICLEVYVMYIFSEFAVLLIAGFANSANTGLEIMKMIPSYAIQAINPLNFIDLGLSLDGLVAFLFGIINILFIALGIYFSYKETKN